MSIHQSAINLLNQLTHVVRQMDEVSFRTPISTLSGSSVGQHVRHTLEFFICLMDAKNEHVINYDDRKHDKFIEQEPKLALSVIDSIVDFISKEQEDFSLTMRANYEIIGDEVIEIKTNFLRELAYNIEHAIHHMALIKIGVKAISDSIELPDHFGVASSTVKFQQQGQH